MGIKAPPINLIIASRPLPELMNPNGRKEIVASLPLTKRNQLGLRYRAIGRHSMQSMKYWLQESGNTLGHWGIETLQTRQMNEPQLLRGLPEGGASTTAEFISTTVCIARDFLVGLD